MTAFDRLQQLSHHSGPSPTSTSTSTSTTPIRVGITGLSNASWATTAHLPYLQHTDKYRIVAVQNSSVESARTAVRRFALGDEVRAYGDPEALALDPNVDLVVCSVRVDRHLANISPSLRAGKSVYVEWPLGANLAEAEALLALKKKHGVRLATVGLQGRQAPIVKQLKKMLDERVVGDVLSSTWQGQAGTGGQSETEALEYLGRRESGGNVVTIHFGHAIDYVQQVLGTFHHAPSSLLANRRPTITLLSSSGSVLSTSHPKTADDTIFLHGTLGAATPLSFSLRGGAPFLSAAAPGLDWRIYGSTAEIRVTAAGPFLHVGYPGTKIEVHDFEKGEVREVKVERDRWDTELPGPARNVGRVYEALSEGRENCSFEDAVERHRLIEEMYIQNGWHPSSRGKE